MKSAESSSRQLESVAEGKSGLAPVSLPKGGGAIQGIGEKFDVSFATGTASIAIPIPTSVSRGINPELSLSYSSGNGTGVFGLGWSLSESLITRKTDKGLLRYRNDDIYVLFGEDLAPRNRDQPGNIKPDEERGDYMVRIYSPRIEGRFDRIERWTLKSDPNQIHCQRTISSTNTTFLYGRDELSRIQDP
jgi:hypothetical protein